MSFRYEDKTTEKDLNSISFFDGETIKDKYILLGNEEKYILNKKGLTLKESLDFLFENSKKWNYFFRMDYDLNMIFAKEELTEQILNFFDGEETKFFDYEVLYFRHKMLFIKKGKTKKKFYDISNFFMASFLNTLKILNIEVNKKDLEFLEKYKLLRSKFNSKDLNNIILYNKTECIYGIKIVKSIYNLLPDFLKSLRLYGSSGLAHEYLREAQIHKINFFNRNNLNNKIFESAYFGGRMEALKIGTVKGGYKYDINSAYPSEIKELRTVIKLEYRAFKKKEKIIETNLYYCQLNILDAECIGLLPFRLKSGYLIFPADVKGWYYGKEIKEVQDYIKSGLSAILEIKKQIHIELGEKVFNNKEIENLYSIRLKLKEKGDLQNYIYKILLNSIYGKFAQQTGAKTFLSFYYAGLITSGTRAKLLKAVKYNVYDVVFFATDGIYIKKKLDLPISEKLGDWEQIKIKNMIVLQSGIYKGFGSDGKIYEGERGFKMDFDKAIEQIKNKQAIKIGMNIFIGNRYFYKNKFAFKNKRCKFKEIIKIINPLHQIKRNFLIVPETFNINKTYNSDILTENNIEDLQEIEPIAFEEDLETFDIYQL